MGTLGASLLGNLLSVRGIVRAWYGTKRVGYGLKKSDSTLSFNKLWHSKILWKWAKS